MSAVAGVRPVDLADLARQIYELPPDIIPNITQFLTFDETKAARLLGRDIAQNKPSSRTGALANLVLAEQAPWKMRKLSDASVTREQWGIVSRIAEAVLHTPGGVAADKSEIVLTQMILAPPSGQWHISGQIFRAYGRHQTQKPGYTLNLLVQAACGSQLTAIRDIYDAQHQQLSPTDWKDVALILSLQGINHATLPFAQELAGVDLDQAILSLGTLFIVTKHSHWHLITPLLVRYCDPHSYPLFGLPLANRIAMIRTIIERAPPEQRPSIVETMQQAATTEPIRNAIANDS